MTLFRAYPYAKALFEVVREKDPQRVEAVADELDRVAAALEAVPDFQRVLETPVLSVEAKTKVVDEVLDVLAVGELTRRFVHVVQHNYRMQHMQDIARAYHELVDRSLGRIRAKVETATALDEIERGRLVEAISAIEGATVVADFEAKPELIAGFRMQVGSRVFDGSLSGELDRLSRQIEIEQG